VEDPSQTRRQEEGEELGMRLKTQILYPLVPSRATVSPNKKSTRSQQEDTESSREKKRGREDERERRREGRKGQGPCQDNLLPFFLFPSLFLSFSFSFLFPPPPPSPSSLPPPPSGLSASGVRGKIDARRVFFIRGNDDRAVYCSFQKQTSYTFRGYVLIKINARRVFLSPGQNR